MRRCNFNTYLWKFRYVVKLVEKGADIMPIQIKRSGTKLTVKVSTTSASRLNSVRSHKISPQKGTKNPPHIHIKAPKSILKKKP